ncbi:MAG: glutamyl-tRNA reductase [Bacteroidetes bacterium HGW-Bacteroidetes-4]|jgi:glutamyl-tRNA reductase|nr:MAG: glutamyl-tRNA reductase [Bacteroidetes bacterium HGW-Bacteroidetes-4]
MIGVLGINYESSPIEIREKFSFNEQRIIDFYRMLSHKEGFAGIVILSTCNRSEFYFQMEDCCETAAFSYMLRSLKSFCAVEENIRDYFYFKANDDAFKHLFYVVSGANSMILGEDQIVRQVKEALRISADNNLAGTELTRLFTKSFEANKRIRTQTKINQGAFSVSYAGVEKCLSIFPQIEQTRIFLIGAGETGTLTLKSLLKKGCSNIVITNRTPEKAQHLANKYKIQAIPFVSLEAQLEYSDIIIVSTGSQLPLITQQMVEAVSKSRNNRKQLFIDLSVPRNVESGVSSVQNTIVYDVDDLQEVVKANQEKRRKLIGKIDSIIAEYLDEFNDWLTSRNLGVVIANIKTNFNTVNQSELEGFKRINKATENDLLDNYGTHITEKYTRLLIKNLKEVTNNGRKMEYIKMLNQLFDLN